MRRAVPVLILMGLAAPALAEGTERFRLEKTADGYVRMDTTTGTMSRCTEEGTQLVCRMAADDRTPLEDETERLRAQIEALEARVDALERTKVAVPLPSDEDIDKTLGVVERLLRGFVGIAKDLDRETGGDGLAPNRT